jgi:hypothetical protein
MCGRACKVVGLGLRRTRGRRHSPGERRDRSAGTTSPACRQGRRREREEGLYGPPVPAHLLLLDHPLGNDRALDKRSRNRLTASLASAIVLWRCASGACCAAERSGRSIPGFRKQVRRTSTRCGGLQGPYARTWTRSATPLWNLGATGRGGSDKPAQDAQESNVWLRWRRSAPCPHAACAVMVNQRRT